MRHRLQAGCHDQAAVRLTRKCSDATLELVGVAHVNRMEFDPEGWRRHGLNRGELTDTGSYRGVAKDGYSRHVGCELFEKFEPFSAEIVFKCAKAGGVATRPSQTGNKTSADRINDVREHDWQGVSDTL